MRYRHSTLTMLVSTLAVPLLLTASLPADAAAGPPWIAVELPANPLNATTRGAFLLVRTYHHGDAVSAPLTGQAIGTVDGSRRAFPLAFERTSIPGVYAVQRTWPETGAWVLAIHLGEGTSAGATALVGIAADGQVRSVDVPTRQREGLMVPRPVSQRDIDAALTSVSAIAAVSPADAGQDGRTALGALVLLPLGAGLGLALRRRR